MLAKLITNLKYFIKKVTEIAFSEKSRRLFLIKRQMKKVISEAKKDATRKK